MSLKNLAIFIAIGCASLAGCMALYTLYATWAANQGAEPVAQLDYKSALINAYNYLLPISCLCLLYMIYLRKVDPVSAEVFMLTTVIVFGASLLVHKAAPVAFGPGASDFLEKTVWWIPEETNLDF